MKLKELVANTDWNQVKSRLLRNYPDSGQSMEAYQLVFDTLSSLAPQETKIRVCIEMVFREGIDEEPYIEVFGKDGTLNKNLPDFRYFSKTASKEFANSEASFALDLVPWEEWLGMELDPSTIDAYSGHDIAAHCLWEMTFFGFDQETIKEQRDELRRRAREVDDMTEDERNRKLIPWEQIRKELDKLAESSEGKPAKN
jgi:hypothetical protein